MLWFFLVHCRHFFVGRERQLIACNYRFWRLGASYNQHIFRVYSGHFEKIATCNGNGVFSQASCISRANTALFVCLSVCIRSMVMRVSREVTTIAKDSDFGQIVHCFATQVVTCPCTWVPSKILTAGFLTTWNHKSRFRAPILTMNRMIPCTLIDFFVVVRSLGASSVLLWRIQYRHK